MKAVAIWVLRYLLIPAGFLWAAGIFSLIQTLSSSEDRPKDGWSTFSEEEMCTLEISLLNFKEYGDSLIETRKKMIKESGLYSPYLYFKDLKQYRMFEVKYEYLTKEKPFKGRTYMRQYGFVVNGHKDQLVAMRDENWRRVDWDNLTLDHKGNKVPMNIQVKEAQYDWFPEFAKKDMESQSKPFSEILVSIFSGILVWFFGFYLKGLPIAFVLFVIWRLKFKSEIEEEYWGEKSKPQFESSFAPLSFLMSLTLWPVILYRNIKDKLDNNLRKAEILSRRKNILSLLSKQDKELYTLSKKMSLKEFRVHLDDLGLKRKHSFAVALLVVFFFAFNVKIYAGIKSSLGEKYVITNIVIDHDVGSTYFLPYDYRAQAVLPMVVLSVEETTKTKIIFSIIDGKVVTGFTRLIDGVPKFQINSLLKLIS